MNQKAEILLSVKELNIGFPTDGGQIWAVQDVGFDVKPGETMCIVGESGCGKSLTALSILRLLPESAARYCSGSIVFEGQDLLQLTDEQICRVRGNDIGMIFQEPMTSLNPVITVGNQIREAISQHNELSNKALRNRTLELLDLVKIPEPDRCFKSYPHQLSGGMRQRVMIAIAIACRPKLLIADEPTTALDVTIQAEILELIRSLQSELGMALVLITHDLGVVAHMAQKVMVMYAGWKVEEASVMEIFRNPLHPYTRALLGSSLKFGDPSAGVKRKVEIPGIVPALHDMPPGCPFEPRCGLNEGRCKDNIPESRLNSQGRQLRCFVTESELQR